MAKRNFDTDWMVCIAMMVRLIESDKSLILRSNDYQELLLHHHISGLWDVEALRKSPSELYTGLGVPGRTSGEPGLLGISPLPAILHVVLVVPRNKLALW